MKGLKNIEVVLWILIILSVIYSFIGKDYEAFRFFLMSLIVINSNLIGFRNIINKNRTVLTSVLIFLLNVIYGWQLYIFIIPKI
jgi:hypothetical protein